ncbi:MAG TPA: hypothetical protein V6D23_17150 [Candidatus Obscuribacterales bacterium]
MNFGTISNYMQAVQQAYRTEVNAQQHQQTASGGSEGTQKDAPPKVLRAHSLVKRDEDRQDARPESEEDLQVLLLEKFIEMLTGKKIRWHMPKFKLEPAAASKQMPQNLESLQQDALIKARGLLQLPDGEEFALDLEVGLSRELLAKLQLPLEPGETARLQEPVVLNLGVQNLVIDRRRFSFVLDGQGQASAGSGPLASSGNDPDAGWIDAEDPVFEGLRIWTQGEDGNYRLQSLAQAGVGAIWLGPAQTPAPSGSDSIDLAV